MRDNTAVLSLLAQRKELFEQYESETKNLIACELEAGEACLARRQALIQEIDEVSAQITKQLSADPQRELIENAIKNRSSAGDLPQEILPFFEIGQQTFAVMSRIRRMEGQAAAGMQAQKEVLLEKIKQNNQSSAAQISKYFTGLSGSGNSFAGFGKA